MTEDFPPQCAWIKDVNETKKSDLEDTPSALLLSCNINVFWPSDLNWNVVLLWSRAYLLLDWRLNRWLSLILRPSDLGKINNLALLGPYLADYRSWDLLSSMIAWANSLQSAYWSIDHLFILFLWRTLTKAQQLCKESAFQLDFFLSFIFT